MKTVKETLIAAKELLIKNGWCQGTMRNSRSDKSSFCLVGAINHVLASDVERMNWTWDDEEFSMSVLISIRNVIKQFKPNNSSIVDWNDTHGRTKAEVIAILDKAIASET